MIAVKETHRSCRFIRSTDVENMNCHKCFYASFIQPTKVEKKSATSEGLSWWPLCDRQDCMVELGISRKFAISLADFSLCLSDSISLKAMTFLEIAMGERLQQLWVSMISERKTYHFEKIVLFPAIKHILIILDECKNRSLTIVYFFLL